MEHTKQALQTELMHKAYNLRRWSLISTTEALSGHPTSCLSAADIASVVWFHAMHRDLKNIHALSNDYFILSKGHAAPLLYAIWHELGFVSTQELIGLRHFDSVLEGHPTPRFPCVDVATGSLGIGLSIGMGIALNKRIQNVSAYTYVMMGDSEIAEGSVWEAAENAAHYKLNKLIAIIDMNRLGQTGETLDAHHPEKQQARWQAFGWNAIVVDGHSIPNLIQVFDAIKTTKTDKPTVIIAKTYKGYGISAFENKEGFHGKPLTKAELPAALDELKQRFAQDYEPAEYVKTESCPVNRQYVPAFTTPSIPTEISQAQSMATRKAFGIALREYGKIIDKLVVLDAEVKNSTYTELFEQAFPQRFIECFIAEQCMIGAATGFAATHALPCAATFGAFLTRAHDQIRMAAISQAPLRIMGSHAGVSIGEDGPSQMALEDIAMMRALPESIVLYPSDAVATFKLAEQMIRYNKGISYMRTTRAATPKIYDEHETFPIGGCKILKQGEHDAACIIAAGITLFEALKAYELLAQENIFVSVIDCYSIKPLDIETIRSIAEQSCSRVVTVEDHYPEGGLGEAVCSGLINKNIHVEQLAVTHLPRSGKPEELLGFEAIDAHAIISRIRMMLHA